MIYKKLANFDYNFNDLYRSNDPHKFIPLGGVDAEYLVFNNRNVDYDDTKFIIDTLLKYSKDNDFNKTYSELNKYFNKNIDHILIYYIDNLNKVLVDNKKKLDPTFILNVGNKIIHTTKNIELFKLGIYFLSCVVISEETRSEIILFSLCDEFSFYCLFYHIINFKDSNNIIFEVVKKLRGWGKLYFIQELKVLNNDIRKYLINDGFKSNINNSYLVSSIVEKINLVDYLNKNIKEDEFVNISFLIDALFNDHLFNSLGAINNTLLLFERYYDLFKKYSKNYYSYFSISLIYLFLKDDVKEESLLKADIKKYICSKNFKNILIDNINNSNDDSLRYILFILIIFNIDLEKNIYNIYSKDTNKYYYCIEYLMKYSKYKNKVIKMLEDNFIFDLEDVDSIIRLNYDYDFKLIQIIRDIRLYPGTGNKFIEAGLRNSNYYVRKETISCIYEWYREGNKDLKEYSFYNYLVDLLDNETIKELKNNLNNLFDREENLDYLDNIKLELVDSNLWINISDVDNIFSKKIIDEANKLKIKKIEKIDNMYKIEIDDNTIIINLSIDSRIKWFNCTCGKNNCIHLCRALLEVKSKEV